MNANPLSKPGALTLLGASFGLAALHQYLFNYGFAGISFPLFVLLFYVFMLVFGKNNLRRPLRSALWMTVPVLLLAVSFALFRNPLFQSLNMLAVPALVLLHLTYLMSERKPGWASWRLPKETVMQLVPHNLRQWPAAADLVRNLAGGRLTSARSKTLGKVGIGLLFAFPLLLLIVSLLSSADGVFGQLLARVPQLMQRLSLAEIMIRTVWCLVLGLIFFGFARGFQTPVPNEPASGELWNAPAQAGPLKLDAVIAITILCAVNAVYLLFVGVQFTYLFGAIEGLLPAGTTYAEYARSGFLELVLVSGINFCLLVGMFVFGERKQGAGAVFLNILLYLLTVCTAVMLYSAYSRLALYEEAYGYTYIRFLVHAFMIFLAVLLIVTAVAVSRPGLPLAKCYIVLGLAAYVLMNYIGMDAAIARQNIERYEQTGVLDIDYLATLSPDAVPLLVGFSRANGGLLDGQLRDRWWRETGVERPWTLFNASDYRAQRALGDYFEGR